MRAGPIVALFFRVPLGSRSSQPGGTIKNLPILPPCEELLPPTTPKDSSEAPFEAVLARDGFFYAHHYSQAAHWRTPSRSSLQVRTNGALKGSTGISSIFQVPILRAMSNAQSVRFIVACGSVS